MLFVDCYKLSHKLINVSLHFIINIYRFGKPFFAYVAVAPVTADDLSSDLVDGFLCKRLNIRGINPDVNG